VAELRLFVLALAKHTEARISNPTNQIADLTNRIAKPTNRISDLSKQTSKLAVPAWPEMLSKIDFPKNED